ncbi:MAG: carotenoid oxygenase family protein [Blastomonas sp.]
MASIIEKSIRSAVTKGAVALAGYNRKRMPKPDRAHPYLTGIHEPMTSEETLEELAVEGSIPPQLDGRYLRIGPNPVTPPDPASYHWFIGDGMAHGIRISDGKALWYRNRWIRSNAVSAALGEEPAPGKRNPRTDMANTNIVGINGRTFAIVEAGGHPVELSDGLDTIAHNPFDGTLSNSYSAHPHHDPETDELHAICYDAQTMDTVWHVVIDAAGKVVREEPIAVKDGPSIHDCAITRNHVLVFDLPAVFSMRRMISGYAFPYDWNPSHPARVGLCPRNGSGADTIWCDVDPCYVYHPANAFETDDGKVVVDVVVHESTYAASTFGPGGEWSRLERWTLDPVARKVSRDVLHAHNQEFPRYDERRTTRPYRYIYAMALAENANREMDVAETRLFKHDLEARTAEVRDFGPNRHPGEFVFVPRSADGAEDDGWLIGLVIDMNSQTTELQILNADDFAGPAQAVIRIPHRIPPGFHGNWVPA